MRVRLQRWAAAGPAWCMQASGDNWVCVANMQSVNAVHVVVESGLRVMKPAGRRAVACKRVSLRDAAFSDAMALPLLRSRHCLAVTIGIGCGDWLARWLPLYAMLSGHLVHTAQLARPRLARPRLQVHALSTICQFTCCLSAVSLQHVACFTSVWGCWCWVSILLEQKVTGSDSLHLGGPF